MTTPDRALPDWLVAHAREFYDSGKQPVTPRRAATVVLLREVSGGFEAYTIKRAASMAFASGMHAFPGGSVDPRDATGEIQWVGPAASEWAQRLGLEDESAARLVVCAAVRETFEESGVLLAGLGSNSEGGSGGAAVFGDVSGPEWEADREALVDRRLGFAEFLTNRGLALRSDLLAGWSRWITPEFEPRRYDTCFFLAALPSSQRTRDVGGEADGVAWVKPADAIRQQQRGEIHMLPPTAATLTELAAHPTVAAALADSGKRRITPITPRVTFTEEGAHITV
ncbi:MAG: NUDIX hydrolase [Micromonosporaceae bacterium]